MSRRSCSLHDSTLGSVPLHGVPTLDEPGSASHLPLLTLALPWAAVPLVEEPGSPTTSSFECGIISDVELTSPGSPDRSLSTSPAPTSPVSRWPPPLSPPISPAVGSPAVSSEPGRSQSPAPDLTSPAPLAQLGPFTRRCQGIIQKKIRTNGTVARSSILAEQTANKDIAEP
jgi:hypothetical protein